MSAEFVEVMRYAVQLLVVVLAGSFVLYLMKALDLSETYATHSNTYTWFWTLAYMRGVVPAGLLLMMWTVATVACFYRVVVLPSRTQLRLAGVALNKHGTVTSSLMPAKEERGGRFRYHVLPSTAAFVANACITITVNALYIFSTQQALRPLLHFVLQLSLSIFRLLYSAIALPILSGHIRSRVDVVRFRFLLVMFNNLLIPCLVTALTSDSCFQVRMNFVLQVCKSVCLL